MIRLTYLAAVLTLLALHGCATSPHPLRSDACGTSPAPIPDSATAPRTGSDTPRWTPVTHLTEVPVEKNAPEMEGHPLTSVVVTQCNLIVAVYMTMPDGRLLRFDHSAALPTDELMTMAYSATRSERVEVSCNDSGAAGYEKHDPV